MGIASSSRAPPARGPASVLSCPLKGKERTICEEAPGNPHFLTTCGPPTGEHRASGRLAIGAVNDTERRLGLEPRERSEKNQGWGVEPSVPCTGQLRFTETKGHIKISRALNSSAFPAEFIPVAAINPARAGIDALLKFAMEDLDFSARAYDNALRVARTIVDLEGDNDVKPQNIAQAMGSARWIEATGLVRESGETNLVNAPGSPSRLWRVRPDQPAVRDR
jgi:hypothetical protein